MSKKIPGYLLDKEQIVGSVLFSVFFALVFLNLYTPFSSTAWFNLTKSVYFSYTVGVIAIATCFIIVSRIIMYHTRHRFKLSIISYGVWLFMEMLVIALFYTFITWKFIREEANPFLDIFPKALLYTLLILIIPYAISILYGALRDRNKTLRLLNYGNVVTDGDEARQHSEIIYLTDYNGNLRFSVKLDNLYYIESQDNYIKVFYMNKGTLCNYMIRSKLKAVEESFAGSTLVRCHRCFVVNVQKVKVIRREKDSLYAEMDCPGINAIPVSKSYSEKILSYFSA